MFELRDDADASAAALTLKSLDEAQLRRFADSDAFFNTLYVPRVMERLAQMGKPRDL